MTHNRPGIAYCQTYADAQATFARLHDPRFMRPYRGGWLVGYHTETKTARKPGKTDERGR